MLTSTDIVKSLQAHYGGVSVYRVAKQMGLGNGRVLNWLNCRAAPNATECIRLADMLKIDRGYLLACMDAQRQSDPEIAEVYASIATRIAA